MNPGTFVLLPDGRTGYYQRTLSDGSVVLTTTVVVPAATAKGMKEVK